MRPVGGLIFFLAATLSWALSRAGVAETRRELQPYSLGLSSGQPGVSWIGVGAGLQLRPDVQILLGHGAFSSDEFRLRSTGLESRVFFLDRNFSPFLSLGLTHIQLSGTGKFRELDSSALLAELGLGAEYYFEQNLRLAVGWAVHVPIRIQIPFVELSFGF